MKIKNQKLKIMRHTILPALLLICFATTAQINKGSVLVGGDIIYLSNSYQAENVLANSELKSRSSSFLISPMIGFAVKDNLLFGFGFGYSNNTTKNKSITDQERIVKTKTNNYSLSVWGRKFYPISKSFYFFLQGGLTGGIGRRNDKNDPVNFNNITENSFKIGVNAYPGISYQLRKNFILDAALNNLLSLNYEQRKTDEKITNAVTNSRTNTSFNLSSSIANGSNPLKIGVRWIIPKK